MKTLFLHPGATKTATSTLQDAVFAHHPEIFYLGKIDRNRVPRGARNSAVYEVLSELFWSRTEPEPALMKAQMQKEIFSQVGQGQKVLASWESLIQRPNFLGILERFRLADIEVKVLITLRNPLTWLTSHYLQAVQGQFINRNREGQFQGMPYMSLDQYIARWEERKGSLSNCIRYVSNTRQALETLGPDHVKVMLFEDLKVDADGFFRGFADALTIDGDEVVRLSKGAFSNPRLQRSEVDLARKTAGSRLGRFLWRHQLPPVRNLALTLAKKMTPDDVSAKIVASDELNRKIIDATREDLVWLNETLNLPFEQYGYPQ